MRSNLISHQASKRESNASYNIIKQQLEAENEILMQERKNISKKISQEYQDLQTDQSAQMSSNEEQQGRDSSKANAIKQKIKDIIEICGTNGQDAA